MDTDVRIAAEGVGTNGDGVDCGALDQMRNETVSSEEAQIRLMLQHEERERQEQEEADQALACALANEPTQGMQWQEDDIVKRLQEERDLTLAMQMANGRSLQDIERLETAFGIDPTEVLQNQDVAERSLKKVALKCRQALKKDARHVVRAHMSSEIAYYSSNVFGHGWDCGYKNLQMIFSSLLHDKDCAAHLLKFGISEVPSLPEIQGRIEEAWRLGFDEHGKKELGGALVDETKWIGTTEVVALLRSLRIRAEVMDFSATVHAPGEARKAMLAWVLKYYDKRCSHGKRLRLLPQQKCFRCAQGSVRAKWAFIPPLFLQHPGHSRTVIGVELSAGVAIELIILDPNMSFAEKLEGIIVAEDLRFGEQSAELGATSYQVVYISTDMFYLNDIDWENSKSIVTT